MGALLPDEYSGGTFTVSNLHVWDYQFTNNKPMKAILSVVKVVGSGGKTGDSNKTMANITINWTTGRDGSMRLVS